MKGSQIVGRGAAEDTGLHAAGVGDICLYHVKHDAVIALLDHGESYVRDFAPREPVSQTQVP